MNDIMGAAAPSSEIAQHSQTNFAYAFFFLSPERRQALNAVYAYCRLIDDIVDGNDPDEVKRAALSAWRTALLRAFDRTSGPAPTTDLHPVARDLQQAQRRFGLRYEDALAVLVGCETDLHKRRYATWEETYDYCYHVASSVGLLCIALFGCTHPKSRDYAIHLGHALQLTNILRDIAEDATRDRLYIPLEALAPFGLTESDLMSGQPLPPDKHAAAGRLLSAVARRAREEFRKAREARTAIDRRALLPAEIMGAVYAAILTQVESRGPSTLLHTPGARIRLSRPRKVAAALRAILRTFLPA